MNESSERKVPWGMFLGIAVLSASLLAFQVLLTRLCALRLAFHFSFLIISNSLLGIGAAGSLLTLLEQRLSGDRPDIETDRIIEAARRAGLKWFVQQEGVSQ